MWAVLWLLKKITAVEGSLVYTANPSSAKLVDFDRRYGALTLSEYRGASNLPGALSFAFLPHTYHSKKLAKIAQAAGKDILLHAPMRKYL